MPKNKKKQLTASQLAKRTNEYQTMYYWQNTVENGELFKKLNRDLPLSQKEQYLLRKQIEDAKKATAAYGTAKKNEKRWWRFGNKSKIRKANQRLEELKQMEDLLDAKAKAQEDRKETDKKADNWSEMITAAKQQENPAYLDKLEILLAKADDPKLPLADLLDPEKCKAEKETARKKWMDAVRDFDGKNCDALGEMLTACQKTLANMDFRKEAFLTVGVKNTLSPADARTCMYAPENQDKLNDFLASASGLADVFDEKMLQAVEKGNQDKGITPEEKQAFGRAKDALTNAFRYEREWKLEKEYYAKYGEKCIDNPGSARKIMAKKFLKDVQRERLLLDGKPGNQSHFNTKVIAGAEKETMNLFEMEKPKSVTSFHFGNVGNNLKLNDVFEKDGIDPAVEQTALCGVKKSASNVTWDKRREIGLAKGELHDALADLSEVSVFNAMDRGPTMDSMIKMYGLIKGHSLMDLKENPELNQEMAREFIDFVKKNGMSKEELEISKEKDIPEETKNKIKNIKEFYDKVFKAVGELRLPDVDFSDPKQQAAVADEMVELISLEIDLSQSVGIKSTNLYKSQFKGLREKVNDFADQSATIEFAKELSSDASVPYMDILNSRMRENVLGNAIGGLKLEELTTRLPVDMDDGYGVLIGSEMKWLGAAMVENKYFRDNLLTGKENLIPFVKELYAIQEMSENSSRLDENLKKMDSVTAKLRREREERQQTIKRPESAKKMNAAALQNEKKDKDKVERRMTFSKEIDNNRERKKTLPDKQLRNPMEFGK